MARRNKIAVIGAKISPQFLTHGPGRKAAIVYLSSFGFQCVHTPFQLAASMVNRFEDLSKCYIRVIFNLEFLEILFEKKMDMSRVQYVGDTEIECRFARKVYGVVDTVLADEVAWDAAIKDPTNIQETFMAKMNKAADVTFTNPPYNGGIDLKIIMALKEAGLLKKLVCVHPSTWLVDVKTQLGEKTGNHLFRKFRDMAREHITRVEMFNGNPIFNVMLFVPCVITEVDFSKKRVAGSIKVKDVGAPDWREVLDINDITVHGKNWDPTVKEFMGRVIKYIAKNGSLDDNYTSAMTAPKGKYYIQIANIRGHVATETMTQDDFYTFIQKEPENNKGIRKMDDGNQANVLPIFSFESEKDSILFLNYFQTDFARLCLSLTKIKSHLVRGELRLVPWLDFTKEWDDDKLFTMLGYPRGHAIREYAKKFLPDYHNIYPNGKTY